MEPKSRNVGALVLGVALLFGCGESGPSAASANTTAKPSSTSASAGTGSAATTSSAAAAPSGSADAGKAEAVDVSDILNDKSEDNAGVLSVDLSQVDENAPALGGPAPAAPPAPAGKQIEWVPIGPLQFVNPGWDKKKINNDIGLFVSPDNKAGIAFSHFDTPANGEKRVNEMTTTFGFKEVKWSKSKQVKVGTDTKFPAIVRKGTGKDAKGKPMKLFFALIKTGQPMNIVALGGADTDAPEETMKLPLMIVATPKAAAGAPAPEPKK